MTDLSARKSRACTMFARSVSSMDAPQPWVCDIRRTRHIGDFSKWKDYDLYQKALARLLRDLRQMGKP